jgi:hypothetical protein
MADAGWLIKNNQTIADRMLILVVKKFIVPFLIIGHRKSRKNDCYVLCLLRFALVIE